jgi:hypothetical protein
MSSSRKRETLLVFLLLAFTYAYFYHDPDWNGNSRLGLTFAIVQEGRLTIDSFHEQEGTATGDKSFYNGHYYTDKAIGSSLIALLFYFPIYKLEELLNFHLSLDDLKYLLTFLSIGLPSALAGSLMYMLCMQVIGNNFRAYVSTIAITLGTMILPYSVIFFGHQLVGSLLFIVFFLIFQLKENPVYCRKGIFFLVGFLLGLAFITEYTVAPIVLMLAAYIFFVMFKDHVANRSLAVILAVLGAFIPVSILLAYNTAVYGNPLSIGYSYMASAEFQQAHSRGLIGVGWPDPKVIFFLTLHPAMGLFWQSPVLILALTGIWFMWRVPGYRAEALVALAAFLSLLLINSGHYLWWGGYAFGPRHLTPMLPFLCLPLVFIPKRWFLGVVILSLISIMQMFIVVSSRILVQDDYYRQIDQRSYFAYTSIYSECLQTLFDGKFSSNIAHKFFGLNTWSSLVPISLVILVITLVFVIQWYYSKSLPVLENRGSIFK